MAIEVILPKQGQSVESCIITEIKKKKGDVVKKGDVLFAYETDKASFEEESPVDGVVLECFYNEGDEVEVLLNMMVIGEPGEDYSGLEIIGTENITEPTDPAEPTEPSNPTESSPAIQQNTTTLNHHSFISPRAKALASKEAIDFSQLKGSGPNGRVIEKDVKAALEKLGLGDLAVEEV